VCFGPKQYVFSLHVNVFSVSRLLYRLQDSNRSLKVLKFFQLFKAWKVLEKEHSPAKY